MKILKKLAIGLLTAAAILAGVFLAGRYGWRVMGFNACQGAAIESVEVSSGAVRIRGLYPGSFPEGFCGHYAEERDGRLYVGVRFSAVFGCFETGNFDITIPVADRIDAVILKTWQTETTVWTAETRADSGKADAPDNPQPETPDETQPETPEETPEEAQPALTLPILDEIDQSVAPGTAGASLQAVQAAVKLLDWGVNTGLGTDEIGQAAAAWLAARGDDRALCIEKLSAVDSAYQALLGSDAQELLDTAGCVDTGIFWGSEPVEPVEAIMQAAGLRG